MKLTRYADEIDPPLRLAWLTEGPDGKPVMRDMSSETVTVEVLRLDLSRITVWSSGIAVGDGSLASNVAITFTEPNLQALVGLGKVWLRPVTANGATFAWGEHGELISLVVLPAAA